MRFLWMSGFNWSLIVEYCGRAVHVQWHLWVFVVLPLWLWLSNRLLLFFLLSLWLRSSNIVMFHSSKLFSLCGPLIKLLHMIISIFLLVNFRHLLVSFFEILGQIFDLA